MSCEIKDKVKTIFAAVFSLTDENIEWMTRENTEKWDSMAHTSIVLCIEEEFGLSLEFEDAMELDSFEFIVAFLDSKNAG